jgi:hypothetical protein
LRGFCELDTTFIWVFERGGSFCPGKKVNVCNPVKQNIKRVALRSDGYAARTADGETQYDYEGALQKIELKATPAINKIRAFEEIETSEKLLIAQYILMMAKRRPSRDRSIHSQVEKATAKVVEAAERKMREAALEGKFTEALKIRNQAAYLESDGYTWFLRESLVKDTGQVQQVLTRSLWEFIKAPPGNYFVTSDNPVGNTGLNTGLIFPVSKNVVLQYAGEGKDLTYRQATSEEMVKLNAYIISQAEKEIYSPNPGEWIHKRWADGDSIGSSQDTDVIVL